MSHPGNFPGDPAGQQPAWQPPPGPGAYEYPPIADGYWPPPGNPPPPPYAHYPPPHPPQYPPQYPGGYVHQIPTNGPAIGSLVSALVGIPAYFLCFGFVGSILGIVLGIVALMQIGKNGQKGKEMAIAGIIIGALGLFGMGLFSALVFSPSLGI